MRRTACLALLGAVALPVAAQPAPPSPAPPLPVPLVVIELFTSQGCSTCPPADALMAELLRADPHLLPLALHVTYWDRLGWRDPFSLAVATQRQQAYSAQFNHDGVYTPQAVVAGQWETVGSDRAGVDAAVARARAAASPVALDIAATLDDVRVKVGSGTGAGTLWLVGFDPEHTTLVHGGENNRRRLTKTNVVRAMQAIGDWRGQAATLVAARPAGQRLAVLLQGLDGHILAAAALP